MSVGSIWSALPQSGDIRGGSRLTYHEGPPGPHEPRELWQLRTWRVRVENYNLRGF
jgi:hypothetical protein